MSMRRDQKSFLGLFLDLSKKEQQVIHTHTYHQVLLDLLASNCSWTESKQGDLQRKMIRNTNVISTNSTTWLNDVEWITKTCLPDNLSCLLIRYKRLGLFFLLTPTDSRFERTREVCRTSSECYYDACWPIKAAAVPVSWEGIVAENDG